MSRKDLIDSLRKLSEDMLSVAVDLDYFGGLNSEITQHASELAGAAGVVLTWADGMEEESE